MTTLKGIFPDIKTVKGKNFIHENIKNLRRIEHFNTNKDVDEIHKLQAHNRKKINNNNINNHNHNQNILSRTSPNFQAKKYDVNEINVTANNKVNQLPELCKKSSVPVLNKNNALTKKAIHLANNNVLCKQKKKDHKGLQKSQKLHEKVSSDPNLSYKSLENIIDSPKIKVKNQGIQTLETGNIDDLYSEGVIKYPSKRTIDYNEVPNKNETNEQIHITSRNITSQPSDRGDIQDTEQKSHSKNAKSYKSLPLKDEIDFIKLNKERIVAVSKTTPQTNNTSPLPNYRMGVVPKYIKTRKEIQEKTLKAKEEELDPNCPSGHVPLPDSERKEALRMLKKNYQDYVNELNVMLMKVDTLRAQRRKIEIEKQLVKLEEGIKVFSRPKVYVKMNA